MSSSEESGEEAMVVLSRRCSCWDRYWAGVCLAARAQWRSSLCRRGRFAWQVINKLMRFHSNSQKRLKIGKRKIKKSSYF